ncbi:hypothetical protein [Bifidobacterium simiarum]|uniref:hypothetical protein n=1 Tax=Bifidobacterium simiarum TaxID=2045441 RepID=UPI001BDD41A4|nr:hypothetical protein [Bifidobacterium simiarum]MBT1167274.1 hypothetical protein [Bifidobacterium simiarum]
MAFFSIFSPDAEYETAPDDTIARYRDWELHRICCDTVELRRHGRTIGRAWDDGIHVVVATRADGRTIHGDWIDPILDRLAETGR